MSIQSGTKSLPPGTDALLANLIEEITQALQQGEPVDLEAYALTYPDHAEQLRRLVPAMLLLEHAGAARSRLDATEPTDADQAFVSGVLGDFRILREIGRGGMGVVYEAEQASLGRRVALKVLPFAAVLDPWRLQRFKNEALAAACLVHQNIVPVYSVGCERGVHYYAMQYVEGESLAQVVRDLRQAEGLDDGPSAHPSPEHAEGRPAAESRDVAETATKACDGTGRATASLAARPTKNPEYFRRIARLGIQAAEALDHAHRHGILHRDIKPANLILDTRDNLWITDFGLARFESEASITITGDLVGTLRYMSPEQAQAKRVIVDHRTDIYSLGVTLYELLALEPAYAGSAREEILRQIAFEEPRRLCSRNQAIPAELEIIVLKAMEKVPEDRYGTAQEMADDLRRFLMDEPIRARRPTLTQRLRKWSRRHKSLVASVACIAAILLVAITAVALVQRQAAMSQSELAQRRLRVQAGINQALTEVARLRGVATTDGSTEQAALAAAREQLQRAVALVESGLADPKQDARVRQLWIEFVNEQRDRQLLADLDRAWMAERGADTKCSGYTQADVIPILRKALDAYGVTVGRGSVEDMEVIIRAKPEFVREQLLVALEEWRFLVAREEMELCCNWVSKSATRIAFRQFPEGFRPVLIRPVLISREALPHVYNGNLGLETYDCIVGVGLGSGGGIIDVRMMSPLEFRELLSGDQIIYARFQVISPGKTVSRIVECVNDGNQPWLRAVLEAADKDPWRARLRQAFDISDLIKRREALEKLAEEADLERQHIRLLTRLATNLTASDRAFAFAKQICRRHPDDLLANLTLADICLSKIEPPQLEEAVRYYTAAVALRPDHADPHLNLGNALKDQGKIDEAIAEYREVVRLLPDSPQGYSKLAWLLATSADRKWRQSADAVAMAMKAVELAPKESYCWGTLGAARYAQGQFDEAIEAFGKAFALGSGGAASEWLLRAMAHWQLGQKDEARKWYEQAVAWMKDNKSDKELLRFRAEAEALFGIVAEESPPKNEPPAAAEGGAPGNP